MWTSSYKNVIKWLSLHSAVLRHHSNCTFMVVWLYIYLCSQCLSPLKVLSLVPTGIEYIWYSFKGQWLSAGQWRSPGTSVFSAIKKTILHDISDILLKVALNIKKYCLIQWNYFIKNLYIYVLFYDFTI